MKLRLRPAMLITILLALALGAFGVQAQGPGTDPLQDGKDVPIVAANGPLAVSAGIGDPPPSGFTVVYMFTGVANETDNGKDEATSINCTNYHPTAAVEVRVEVYGSDPSGKYVANQTLAAGATRTWSTQSISAYNDGVILPSVPYIFQGSGRVLTRQHTQGICNAQVLDADADPPVYAVDLEMFRR